VGLLYLLFYRTGLGRLMRATAQDRDTARLIGVRVGRIGTVTFAMASAIGGLAGVLLAPLFLVDLNVGFMAALKAFVATIIGGWGSIPGALAGGLLVGVIEVFATHAFSSNYKDTAAFGVLMLFLVFRPGGMFPERVGEKA
jgi:branched-chain amino acid transport system permease protein